MEFPRQEHWSDPIPFSRRSFRHRDRTPVSCIAGRFFTIWATRGGIEKIEILDLLLSKLSFIALLPGLSLPLRDQGLARLVATVIAGEDTPAPLPLTALVLVDLDSTLSQPLSPTPWLPPCSWGSAEPHWHNPCYWSSLCGEALRKLELAFCKSRAFFLSFPLWLLSSWRSSLRLSWPKKKQNIVQTRLSGRNKMLLPTIRRRLITKS